MKKYLKLFANCISVKGNKRSLLCDIERGSTRLISNDLHEVVEGFNKKMSIKEVLELYGDNNKKIINDYITFIIDNEYGFLCSENEFDLFPKLDLNFYTPNEITNAIIELNKTNFSTLELIKKELESVNCSSINIITYFPLSYDNFKFIDEVFNNSRVTSIEILTHFDYKYNQELFQKIKLLNSRITHLIITNSNEDSEINYSKYLFSITFSTKKITNFKHCGNVSQKYFSINKNKFLESFNHNSCLFKKISIDLNGDIKNCPAMLKKYGNIQNTYLKEAIKSEDFKKYGDINKNVIKVCSDCEFRHVCTDCRAYVENPNDILSKPLKCGYNPYSTEWSDWSSNPLKKKVIEHYNIKLS